jgi:hypothetical protein
MVLYSTNCPKCKVLEKKLSMKNVDFKVDNDVDEMIKLGFIEAPMLKLDNGEFLNFIQANSWINSLMDKKLSGVA